MRRLPFFPPEAAPGEAAEPVFSVDIALDSAALDAAQDRLGAFLEGAGLPAPVQYRARLVVDELVANLMMHGRFAGEPLPARLTARPGSESLLLTLDDAAEPFDPRSAPAPEAPPSLEDDRVGGLGLALLRKMARILAYERTVDGWNRTLLAIPLANPGAK